MNPTRPTPIDEPWPAEGLESPGRCPLCGEAARQTLHEDLADRIFFCAPGRWTLHRCGGCGAGYLDPRPDPASIGLAYAHYYTHTVAAKRRRGVAGNFQRAVANGYRNARYGTRQTPASPLGSHLPWLFPARRRAVDREMRFLPPPAPGARLLDIGCGNGEFLARARDAGWEGIGVEPDPHAAEAARGRGLKVIEGGLERLDAPDGSFDGITLSHVIEHLHQPAGTLRRCHRLLRPGGWIWIETPNLESSGHRRYGAAWRGLEPPRHLVLFTRDSLRGALERCGFDDLEELPWRPLCKRLFTASAAILHGRDPYRRQRRGTRLRLAVAHAELLARLRPERREFIQFRAWKPS